MAVTLVKDKTIGNQSATQTQGYIDVTLNLTANYGTGASHGDVLSFAGTNFIQSRRPPIRVEIYEQPAAGSAPSGYSFLFALGTTAANGQLVVLNTGAALSGPLGEYPQGTAYNAALLAVVLKARIWFPLGQ